MQCPTPLSIRDKSEKNPNNIASKRLSVPCGRCGICQQNRRSQWTFRLREELKDSWNCRFITLTYDEPNLPFDPYTGEISLNKKHLTDFIKRLREYEFRKLNQRSIRYYAVGEYGSKTERPHYHLILFNLSQYAINHLTKLWDYGHIDIGTVTSASIHYVTKYHVNRKTYDNEERTPEFSTMSQGLGKGYLKRNSNYHIEHGATHVYMDGHIINMPRYYKNKLFDKDTQKLYSERNIENAYTLEQKEAQRLQNLGYKQPYVEIFERTLNSAKKIKHKSQDTDKL